MKSTTFLVLIVLLCTYHTNALMTRKMMQKKYQQPPCDGKICVDDLN